ASDIADAVLDEALAGHTTAGTLGKAIADILEDTGTTIPGLIGGLNDFDPQNDVVAHVTLVDTVTTNTDMRGTDSAATAASLSTLAGKVDDILQDTGTTIPGLIGGLNDVSAADVNAACDQAIADAGLAT